MNKVKRLNKEMKYRLFILTTFIGIFAFACSSSNTIQVSKRVVLKRLPELNEYFSPESDSSFYLLVSPTQFLKAYPVICESINYEIAVDDSNIVIYISTKDESFSTPENLQVGNKLSDVRKLSSKQVAKELGWAYYVQLPSNWNAAFVLGDAMTDLELDDNSRINFFFKR